MYMHLHIAYCRDRLFACKNFRLVAYMYKNIYLLKTTLSMIFKRKPYFGFISNALQCVLFYRHQACYSMLQ